MWTPVVVPRSPVRRVRMVKAEAVSFFGRQALMRQYFVEHTYHRWVVKHHLTRTSVVITLLRRQRFSIVQERELVRSDCIQLILWDEGRQQDPPFDVESVPAPPKL